MLSSMFLCEKQFFFPLQVLSTWVALDHVILLFLKNIPFLNVFNYIAMGSGCPLLINDW